LGSCVASQKYQRHIRLLTDILSDAPLIIIKEKQTMKKEIRIYAEDTDGDSTPDEVTIEYVVDGKVIGAAIAFDKNQDGIVEDTIVPADLNGDGRVDDSDVQIMKEVAEAFLKVKW